MLWTLWRAISLEFFRLLLLTVAVLVATIAFAVTIKPLADGKLSADQAIRFMFYAIPPMLAYALPFAAGFAATISIHRMVSENEVTAVYASGISHRKFLLPSLVAGLLLGGTIMMLNDQVIPRFLKQMERMVTQDFAKIFVNSLRNGDSARIGSNEIHADFIERVPPEPGSPVTDQYLLRGVALVKAEPDGTVTIDGTARRAWILLLPAWALGPEDRARINNDDATAVLMKFIDMTINRQGSPITVDPFTLPAFPIPRVFKDDPKFMTGTEMSELRHHPDRMNFVDSKRIDLAKGLAATEVLRLVAAQARAGQAIEMHTDSGTHLSILAGGFSAQDGRWALQPTGASDRIEIRVVDDSGHTDRLSAATATIAQERARADDPLSSQTATSPVLTFTLALGGVRVMGAITPDGQATYTEQAATQYTALRLNNDPLSQLLTHPSPELLAIAQPYITPGTDQYAPYLVPTAERLRDQIEDLDREILSKVHERYAMAGAALVMVLAGSVIALRLKDAQPLVVYMWSFFPALGTIILIATGQDAVHETGPVALPLVYLGLLILLVYTWVAYRRLIRH